VAPAPTSLDALSQKVPERCRDDLTRALEPFWDDETDELGSLLADLNVRGWITTDTNRAWVTTPLGYSFRARAATRVQAMRDRMADGITQADYDNTIAVITRMAANLTPASA
jgi:hypothetical protein